MAMISRVVQRFSKERDLRMLWEVEKDGKCSFLAGTAHFFPFRFRAALRRYIERVETVLFEGPLDEEAARAVAEAGLAADGSVSLVRLLDPRTVRRIHHEIGNPSQSLSSHGLFLRMLDVHPEELDWDRLHGLKPWMAFFQIWSQYLRKNGWTFTMELDALRIATELGRQVHFLESIEDQIKALNSVPLERFVNFLERVNWRDSREAHLKHYLKGDLEGMMANVGAYPTFCDAIVARRDPVLYGGIKRFFERGKAIAFVGVSHCPGIKACLTGDAFRLRSSAAA
jgi:uncharacterized protein YbaP (TraB family)